MIQVYSTSEAGGHAENEDAFEFRSLASAGDEYLCALADGQGGHPGGATAAKLACQTCVAAALALRPAELLRPATWVEIVHHADAAVARHREAGFTTLVAFGITGGAVCGASSGDSAAVLIDPDKPRTILTARQLKNPPVGSGGAIPVGFSAILKGPWVVLAMSDGVWKYTGLDTVIELAGTRRGREMIDAIRDRARLPGSGRLQDDFTLVAFVDEG